MLAFSLTSLFDAKVAKARVTTHFILGQIVSLVSLSVHQLVHFGHQVLHVLLIGVFWLSGALTLRPLLSCL